MKESFYRTAMIYGAEAEAVFDSAHICVFGCGGVGGHAAVALARCGVGRLTLVDAAVVKRSNLNRQVCAEKRTVGMEKSIALKRRIEAVSDCEVNAVTEFITTDNAGELIPQDASVVIDAVDNVTAKIALICSAQERGIPVISSMGAGNRRDPTAVRTCDIYRTCVDPLSRIMRRELRKRNVASLRVVCSTEQPAAPKMAAPDPEMKANAPASSPFVPAAFGMALAAEAIELLLNYNQERRR